MLSFKVRWPVSLVLSKKSLTKYQLLFRHVFFAKHVQRLLSKNSWREHQVRCSAVRCVEQAVRQAGVRSVRCSFGGCFAALFGGVFFNGGFRGIV